MMASVGFLSTLVSVALFITVCSLVILLGLFIKDWKGKRLW